VLTGLLVTAIHCECTTNTEQQKLCRFLHKITNVNISIWERNNCLLQCWHRKIRPTKWDGKVPVWTKWGDPSPRPADPSLRFRRLWPCSTGTDRPSRNPFRCIQYRSISFRRKRGPRTL